MAVETAIEVSGTSVVVKPAIGREIFAVKCVVLETPDTADASDTFTFDISTLGGTTVWGVSGCVHTTSNSVIKVENPTTTVSGTTITFTIPAGTDNDVRAVKVYFS